MPFVICPCGFRGEPWGSPGLRCCPRCGTAVPPSPLVAVNPPTALEDAVERLERDVGRLRDRGTPSRPARRRAWRQLEDLQAAMRRRRVDGPLRERVRKLAWELDSLDPNRAAARDLDRDHDDDRSRRPRDTDLHRWISQHTLRPEDEEDAME
jgi:hypothetical protein